MSRKRMLLIEDETSLAMMLADRLRSEGYEVEIAGDGISGLEAALTGLWDLILLDVMLPGMDGFQVCREFRNASGRTPVLMLTARGEVGDRVAGLRRGADDYLPKPFDTSELLARMEALIRRSGPAAVSEPVLFSSVMIDRQAKIVTRGGELVELSFKEFQMLCYLLDQPDIPVSREELLQKVWGYQHTPTTRTVDVHMAQLRGKLEDNPREPKHFLTVHGHGYKFTR